MPEEYVDPASSARGSKLASNFTVSLTFDRRLYKHEIKTSIAHAKMLGAENIIPLEDSKKIISGLKIIESEIKSGEFVWKEDLEDIHMNVESRLYELIGDNAGKLHTGRSRNDQIATDVRLWVKDACVDLIKECKNLQLSLIELAENNIKTVLPGYTHLQRGQPILLAHHFLAYFEMINRDIQRLQQVYRASDIMPLGSGAISGVPYPINRKMVATELKFSKISSNSIDAVSDRDFIVEFLSSTSICMTHLSKLSEELIIWSTEEFGFVTLSEQFTSGSSIMPQKRNPDFAELIRGKTGRVYGALFGILTILKGLPLAYNRDLQEDKEGLFDAFDTTLSCIRTANGIISTMEINTNAIEKAMKSGFILEHSRYMKHYLFKIMLPVFLILCVAWYVLWIPTHKYETRLNTSIIALLALIAYNFVFQDDIPKLEYLTDLDWYILLSYVFCCIPVFISITSSKLGTKNQKNIINANKFIKKWGILTYFVVAFAIFKVL